MSTLEPDKLRERYAHLALGVEAADFPAESRLDVPASHALELLNGLREDEAGPWVRLVDLTAIDRGEAARRFEVIYRLDSLDRTSPLRVHVRIDPTENQGEGQVEDAANMEPAVDSVVSLWPMASWLEREVFDLFGVRFRGHPELRRLLLPEEFDGAPLRKDFPRAGHPELRSSAGDHS